MIKKAITKILILLEKLLLKLPVKTFLPVIFITGAPRSGTTITYQYFVELGDFCFFTNLERKYFRFPVISALLFRGAVKYRPTDENSYGHIPGKFAPSDGWEIFHRWFPYYHDPDKPIKKGSEKELYRTIAWFQKIYRKPFIVKNNANSLRIKELRRAFPNAFFVHVERDRAEVVDSIVKGMKINKIEQPGLWGTGPRVDLIPKNIKTFEEKAQFQYNFIERYVHSLPYVEKIWFNKDDMDHYKRKVIILINEYKKQASAVSPRGY